MKTDNIVKYGSIILALCVIAASTWVLVMPPAGDEIQGMVLMAIGFFMLVVVYYITRIERKCQPA